VFVAGITTGPNASATQPLTPIAVPSAQSSIGFTTNLPAAGGRLDVGDLGVSLVVPGEALSGADTTLQVLAITSPALPRTNNGFQAGERTFQITLTNSTSGQEVTQFVAPLSLTYQPTTYELALANGDLTRMSLVSWSGALWAPVPCAAVGQQLQCTLTHLTLFSLMVGPVPSGVADYELENGHFYRQTNGFAGAGQAGFSVTDDADADFWTELQRYGGVETVGYPVTSRFNYRGFVTQAFQKLVLQWRPDLGQAMPMNVFDELSGPTNSWLDLQRQVPPPGDMSADQGMPADDLIAAHLALLDAYSLLHDFYLANPSPLDAYGLPLAVHNYGQMVAVRLQRATLQLWTVDTPWATAGTVVVANGGDLAKEVGLWPGQSMTPELPPIGLQPAEAAVEP